MIHCVRCFVPLNYLASVEVRTVSTFILISQDINYISDLYLVAQLTVVALDSFLLGHVFRKTFLKNGVVYFFAVPQIYDVPQNSFLARVIYHGRIGHSTSLSLICFLLKHTKHCFQLSSRSPESTSLAVAP